TVRDLPPETPPIPMRMFVDSPLDAYLQHPLARDVVRYSGEPVAVVVADSRYAAEDAAELVEVEYEPLPVVLRTDEALATRAGGFTIEWGDVEGAFERAALVVEERIERGRHAAVPLETRGLLAGADEASGLLTVLG